MDGSEAIGAVAPTLFYIPYEAFLADLEAVALSIAEDSWRADFLVGIGRGGLVPAAYLSHRTQIPMLSVDLSAGEASFADELLAKLAAKSEAGLKILIVDDINDSGSTIDYVQSTLALHGADRRHVRIAVLINNVRSRAAADYYATEIDRHVDKRWFVFPWEAFASANTLIGEAQAVPERLA